MTLVRDAPEIASGPVTPELVVQLAAESEIVLPIKHEAEWATVLMELDDSARDILTMGDYFPEVDLKKYLRTEVEIPNDNFGGGWALKLKLKCTNPITNELAGLTVAIKDNIGIAGVPCTNGTSAMSGWLPRFDATIVTRILDAGGVVTGKSACENGCYESTSETAVSGVVDNPWANGYSAGGSSSGSASLVAGGYVDMAIGADQGGSIRMPASFCGIVGLKPTWGLVPYTGAIGLDASIDHLGPMTKNVADCALLLQVIAGVDGLDDRQQGASARGKVRYAEQLDQFLRVTDKEPCKSLQGIRIGILTEGFGLACSNSNVDELVQSSAQRLKALGATVMKVSVPGHSRGQKLWGVAKFMGSYRGAALGYAQARKQVYMPERVSRLQVGQQEFDAAGPGARSMMLSGMFLEKRHGPGLYARCKNLLRKLSDDYDAAFTEVDILITPTTPFVAPRHATHDDPVRRLDDALGLTFNTSPLDATGHPAISIPVGLIPAKDDLEIRLPVGMQLIGRKFDEMLVLKIAASWERQNNWKVGSGQ